MERDQGVSAEKPGDVSNEVWRFRIWQLKKVFEGIVITAENAGALCDIYLGDLKDSDPDASEGNHAEVARVESKQEAQAPGSWSDLRREPPASGDRGATEPGLVKPS